MKISSMLQNIIIGIVLPLAFPISRMARPIPPYSRNNFEVFHGIYPSDSAIFMVTRRSPNPMVNLNNRNFVSDSNPTYHTVFGIAIRPGAHGRSFTRSPVNTLIKDNNGCKDPCRGVQCGIGMRCRLVDIPCFSSSCSPSVQPSCVKNVKPVQVNEVNPCNIGEPVLSFSSVINEMNCTVGNKSSCSAGYSCEPALYNGLPKCCYVQNGCMVRKIKTRTVASTVHNKGNKLCPEMKTLGECRQECVNFRDCRYNEICCRNVCGLNQCVRSRWSSAISKHYQEPRSKKRLSPFNIFSRNSFYYSKLNPGMIKGLVQPVRIR